MRNSRVRRFRHRSRGRMHQSRSNGDDKNRIRPQTFSNGRMRNFKPQQSAEKLVEKYNLLAKEALSSGDKVLSENYYQHADHFTRIVVEKDIHKKQNAAQNIQEDQKKETKTSTLDQNSLSENTDNDNKK